MISGVILARNEEGNIVACLESLRPHVAETIVIDMESADRTVELARPYASRIVSHRTIEDFDSARNLAIELASNEWLWFVDADERIPQQTGKLINELLRTRGREFESIQIPFKSYFCGRWMQHCGWWPGYTTPRVLKRGYFRFEDRVHGGVQVSGRQLVLPANPELAIEHYSYRSVEHYLEKLNRYTNSEGRQLTEQGVAWDWREATRAMTRELWHEYELQLGFLDDEEGWILSWLGGQYRWLSHAKLWNRSAGSSVGSQPSIPLRIDDVLEEMHDELAFLRKQQPELPLGVVWRSPIWDPSGYADESRTLIKALARGWRELAAVEICWHDDTCIVSQADAALLRCLSRARRPQASITITNCPAGVCQVDRRSSLNILRTTFETDRIPKHWLALLGDYDEIWVISWHNLNAFRRSGVPAEKLRLVQSGVDTDLFNPTGAQIALPKELEGRFVFLSIFDWQLRKGWDVLLQAYAAEFAADEAVGLYLKSGSASGMSQAAMYEEADRLLRQHDTSLAKRPDIVITDMRISAMELAALYRSVQAFVLPSRGEGWGRPLMEAMASGLATIGTVGSGNVDYMNGLNSLLVSAEFVPVPEHAVKEVEYYRGHRWCEPSVTGLRHAMRQLVTDDGLRIELGHRAAQDMETQFGLAATLEKWEQAIATAEDRFQQRLAPPVRSGQVRVALEGEFFVGHSFSSINESLATELAKLPDVALRLDQVFTTAERELPECGANRKVLEAYFGRDLAAPPQITIRHAFPPNWEPPAAGKWVLIQPWEYGFLPREWLEPLRRVDEIWAPSQYVRNVYERSGVPPHKLHVIPWGVDSCTFSPTATPWLLPTEKQFRFLFVGGTIHRKGIDRLLEAYLAEFGPQEPVCLVIKDAGSRSFYRHLHARAAIEDVCADKHRPEILYLDEHLSAGQLASLYTACDCLVAPYRGEGFGLPILEAMACGLPAIVPDTGAATDFVTPDSSFLLSSRIEKTRLEGMVLCGPAEETVVDIDELRRAMRAAFSMPDEVRRKGQTACMHVQSRFTWRHTAERMAERIRHLVDQTDLASPTSEHKRQAVAIPSESIRPLLVAKEDVRSSKDCDGERMTNQSDGESLVPFHWEPWLEPWIRKTGDVMIDIGAGTGIWTRWLAPHFQQVYSIEPNPECLRLLRQDLPSNVHVFDGAAWSRREPITFRRFRDPHHLSAYFQMEGINTGSAIGQIELMGVPLDSLPIEGKVDFLKCDTEGAEVECLLGGAKTIGQFRPWLLVEVHSSDNLRKLCQLMGEWSYYFTVVRDPNYAPFSHNWHEHCWLSCQPSG